jgi:hypothetical protein
VSRYKPFNEAIIVDEMDGDIRVVVAEPGDLTRYQLWIIPVGPIMAANSPEKQGVYLVSVCNLVGDRVVSAIFRPWQIYRYEDIRSMLGIHAPGSCYYITMLLSHLIDIGYEPYETFIHRFQERHR